MDNQGTKMMGRAWPLHFASDVKALDDVKKLADAKGKRSKSSYGYTLSGLEADAKFFIEQAEPFVNLTLEIAGAEGYEFFG